MYSTDPGTLTSEFEKITWHICLQNIDPVVQNFLRKVEALHFASFSFLPSSSSSSFFLGSSWILFASCSPTNQHIYSGSQFVVVLFPLLSHVSNSGTVAPCFSTKILQARANFVRVVWQFGGMGSKRKEQKNVVKEVEKYTRNGVKWLRSAADSGEYGCRTWRCRWNFGERLRRDGETIPLQREGRGQRLQSAHVRLHLLLCAYLFSGTSDIAISGRHRGAYSSAWY